MSGGCKCRPISVKRNVQTEANVVLSKHAASHGLNKNVALPFLTYTYELVSRVVQKYLLYWLWNRAKPSTVHPCTNKGGATNSRRQPYSSSWAKT